MAGQVKVSLKKKTMKPKGPNTECVFKSRTDADFGP